MFNRICYISRPAYLSKRQGFLEIKFKDSDEIEKIPIIDIGILIIDSHRVTFSSAVISAITKNKSIIIVSDENHYPNSLCFPLSAHHQNGYIVREQIKLNKKRKTKLWKQIIAAKINNQAELLHKNNNNTFRRLLQIKKQISDDNISAKESQAASIYWKNIFKEYVPKFKRERDGIFPNNLLNYGYILLRALTVRAIVSAGMLPQISINHKNEYNSFPLADDLMEPFRPFIDRAVLEILKQGFPRTEELTKNDKKLLLAALYKPIHTEKRQLLLWNAVHLYAYSVAKLITKEGNKLLIPILK